jgi:hypothetical protein
VNPLSTVETNSPPHRPKKNHHKSNLLYLVRGEYIGYKPKSLPTSCTYGAALTNSSFCKRFSMTDIDHFLPLPENISSLKKNKKYSLLWFQAD